MIFNGKRGGTLFQACLFFFRRKPCGDLEMWKMFANFAVEIETAEYGRGYHTVF